MIRLMNHDDMEQIMDIWITAVIPAHRFIDQSFWLKQYRKVKQNLIRTTTYIICEENRTVGFVSLQDQKLSALYIINGMQGKGFGSLLIEHLKKQYTELTADVYVKNNKALRFFKKHHFEIASQHKNIDTHQIQNHIHWHR